MEVNKIYHGDSYKLIKDIPDNSVDCIYTDVPYLYDSGGGGSSELSKRIIKVDKELEDANIVSGFDYCILDDFVRIMKKVNIVIWFSKMQMKYILNYFTSLDKEIYYELLVWGKTNPTPATHNTWLPDLEYAFHFREKGVKLNDGYDIKQKLYVSPLNKKDKDLYDHPTIKPLDNVLKHLEHITQPNDIVFDPFLGSGTTAIASKELGRQYIGFELNEDYFNIAQDRLNNITQIERRAKDNGVLDIFDFMEEQE